MSAFRRRAPPAALLVTQDPSRGGIGAKVIDCLGNLASGVQVTLDKADPLTATYYTGDTAVGGANDTDATATDGVVAFFKLTLLSKPPKWTVVTLKATPVGLARASIHVTVGLKAGVWCGVTLPPTP
jgi:hypothetical protein